MTCLDAYGNTLYYFTQWDTNQKLYITGSMLTEAPMVHFQNRNSKKALVVQSSIGDDGVIYADIPNRLLAEPYPVSIYIYATKENSSKAVWHTTMPVRKRAMPEGFLYDGDTGVLDMSEELKRLEEKMKEMQSQIEEMSGMLEGNVVVDEDDGTTPEIPDENVPEGFWGGTVDIYVDATSGNVSGGETKGTALSPSNTAAQEAIRALADKAQNVNIHIVKAPDSSTISVPLDLAVKHDRTIIFDFMEGCGNGSCRGSDIYKRGDMLSSITFPLKGEYTGCTIKSNDDWDNGWNRDAGSFTIFHSCHIETEGDLRLALLWDGFNFDAQVTQCDDCDIICGGNFRFYPSYRNTPYLEMKNSTLTVNGDWYIYGYGGNRVSPYLFSSCTVNIHEVKLDMGHLYADMTDPGGFFDGTGSDIAIDTITRAEGLDKHYISKGIQNFTMPDGWRLETSASDGNVTIYNINAEKVNNAKPIAQSTINNMTVTGSTTTAMIESAIEAALLNAGISGVTVVCTFDPSYSTATELLVYIKLSIGDIEKAFNLFKSIQ